MIFYWIVSQVISILVRSSQKNQEERIKIVLFMLCACVEFTFVDCYLFLVKKFYEFFNKLISILFFLPSGNTSLYRQTAPQRHIMFSITLRRTQELSTSSSHAMSRFFAMVIIMHNFDISALILLSRFNLVSYSIVYGTVLLYIQLFWLFEFTALSFP